MGGVERVDPEYLYLVKGSGFTLGILHHSISRVFVIYAISERDSNNGSNPDGISLCVWIIVCEIASDVHDGGAPAIETEDFIGEVNDFPALGIGKLHSASPRPRGDVFWTEFLVQFGLEGCELHFRVRRKVEKCGVVGCA